MIAFSSGVAIIEKYIIILSLDMCLGILLVRIPHHVLNEESKQIYRKLRGYLFSRFTKYPRNPRNFLSSKIIRPTVCGMNLEGSGPCQVPFGYTTVVSRVSNVLALAVSYLMLVNSLFKIVAYYSENYPCIFDARLML